MSAGRCVCGGDKPEVRIACDACEERALREWDAARGTPLLPANWWRRFEPWHSCGHGYYFYGRTDLTGTETRSETRPLKDWAIVEACEAGVTLAEPPFDLESEWDDRVSFNFDHLKADDLDGLIQVIGFAREDHKALAELIDTDAFEQRIAALRQPAHAGTVA